MSNPCGCCQSKLMFLRQINGNFMHSMVIPEWFVNHFGGKILRTVKLEAPNGNTYDVGISENRNITFLKSGWASFVNANKIEENYSLMFRYLGNARFKVTIFDSSGKEKAPCCAGMRTVCGVKKPSRFDVDNSSSSFGGTTQSSARERSDSDGSQKESPYSYKKSAKMPATSYSSEELSAEDSLSVDNSVESDDLQMHSNDCVLSGRCYLTKAQNVKIHALVEKIRPEIPVLVVKMKKTNVNRQSKLAIRKDYALKYFPCETTNIILQLPRKNQEWKCRLHIGQSGVLNSAGRRNLHLGNFVRDNCVQEGDICLFQPITKVKEGRFTVIVHLLHKDSIGHSPGGRAGMAHTATDKRTNTKTSLTAHVKEEPTTDGEDTSSLGPEEDGASETPFILPDRSSITPAQEQKVREKVEAIESTVPVYVAIMNRSNVRRPSSGGIHLTIGMKYASWYLEKNYSTRHHRKKNIIGLVLQREGKSRTWDTELRRTADRMMIGKGWMSFARGNRLRDGDLCLFKLVENEEPLKMMVYIIRREKCLD